MIVPARSATITIHQFSEKDPSISTQS